MLQYIHFPADSCTRAPFERANFRTVWSMDHGLNAHAKRQGEYSCDVTNERYVGLCSTGFATRLCDNITTRLLYLPPIIGG